MRQTGMLSLIALAALLAATGCGEKNKSSAMRTPATPQPSANRSVADAGTMGQQRIAREVRHELVMLPYYGVFDNLAYQVDGSTVTLVGQVTRPTLKSDAENVVKRIEGVERVVNDIEVLPLSPNDDRIRIAVYRAIYGQTGLDRYALQAVPPIHIIVKNGQVDLEGMVSSQADKDMANIRANGVPGVFGVTNNLRVSES
jgi:hyperosmotically inducible periplasmic protein